MAEQITRWFCVNINNQDHVLLGNECSLKTEQKKNKTILVFFWGVGGGGGGAMQWLKKQDTILICHTSAYTFLALKFLCLLSQLLCTNSLANKVFFYFFKRNTILILEIY